MINWSVNGKGDDDCTYCGGGSLPLPPNTFNILHLWLAPAGEKLYRAINGYIFAIDFCIKNATMVWR